jgi:hypothetical protein
MPVVHSIYYIDKAIICQRNIDADHTGEDVLESLDGEV